MNIRKFFIELFVAATLGICALSGTSARADLPEGPTYTGHDADLVLTYEKKPVSLLKGHTLALRLDVVLAKQAKFVRFEKFGRLSNDTLQCIISHGVNDTDVTVKEKSEYRISDVSLQDDRYNPGHKLYGFAVIRVAAPNDTSTFTRIICRTTVPLTALMFLFATNNWFLPDGEI